MENLPKNGKKTENSLKSFEIFPNVQLIRVVGKYQQFDQKKSQWVHPQIFGEIKRRKNSGQQKSQKKDRLFLQVPARKRALVRVTHFVSFKSFLIFPNVQLSWVVGKNQNNFEKITHGFTLKYFVKKVEKTQK